MIILASAIGSQLTLLLGISGLILILGLILQRIHQPYIIAYIFCGIALGPHGVALVTDYSTAELIGELGIVMLMFFIGMEISLPDFLRDWRIALFGTGMQVIFSILLMFLIGELMDWSYTRSLLMGFIISLSSSAVVIKLVEEFKAKETKVGRDVITILLTQDILIVPMIILMSIVGGSKLDTGKIFLQLVGGALLIGFLLYLLKKKALKLPFDKQLKADHELQVFGGLIFCFGLAFITSLFELSAGLGALVAGMAVHASGSTKWLHDSLHSFRVLLISIFFISVGMLIDIPFLLANWMVISLLVVGVYVSNHGINALSLRFLGNSWRDSIFGASFLAQIGEFSFILVSLGYHAEIIGTFAFQLTIIIISITIFISPFWAGITQKILQLKQK